MRGEERLGIVAALVAAPGHQLTWDDLGAVPGWDELPDDHTRQHALRLFEAARIIERADDYSWVRLRAEYLKRFGPEA